MRHGLIASSIVGVAGAILLVAQTIPNLPPATSIGASDLLAVDQPNPTSRTRYTTRRATVAQLAAVGGNPAASIKLAPCTAVGDGITDDTLAIQACENARPAGSAMIWPPGTYKITGQITAAKAGSWDMQGATLNVTSLAGPLSANAQGGLAVPVSNFYINGGGSTLNFVPGANAAAVFFSGGKFSRLGSDPIFQAYTTQNSEVAAGAQTVTNSGTSTCASGTYTVVGGTGTAATLTGVAMGGVITSLTMLTPGNYTVFPSNPAPLTGTGCSGSPTATLTSGTNIHVGDTSFVAGQGANTLNPDDWIAVFHLDPGTVPGTGTSNWIKAEIKQVTSVVSNTINVSVPFAQPFSVGSPGTVVAPGAQAVVNSGTSMCASGTYTVVGGTGTAATLTGVAGGGVITSLTMLTPGQYSVFPTNPVALSGTGCSGSPTATIFNGCLDDFPAGTSCWPNLWVKLLNPITNVGVSNLNINATSVMGGSSGIDSDVGVINGDYHHNNINISGLSYIGFFNYNFNFHDNNITHEDSRGAEVSVTNAGRISRNIIGSQGTGNSTCLYLDDGVFGMRIDHNQCYGRSGGGAMTVQQSHYNAFDHNIIVCGATPGLGMLLFSGSGNTFDADTFINCSEGIVFSPDSSTINGITPASNNMAMNTVVRNASQQSMLIAGSSSRNNTIMNLNTDSTDVPPVIFDAGTGTNQYNNQSGTWIMGPLLAVTGPDSGKLGLFAGATKGVRLGADSTEAVIQCVDNTGAVSFQPCVIGGSTFSLQTGAVTPTAVLDADASQNETAHGVWAFDNSTKQPGVISDGTKPTGTTGSCNTAITVAGGATAGTWTSTGVCGLGGTIILTGMPAAPAGYVCFMSDRTTAGVTVEETATSTTSATFTVRALPTGSIATVANDILQYSCMGY